MQAFFAALRAETDDNLLRAITLYEETLPQPQAPLATFTNLAFLYWVVSYDFGVQTTFLQTHAFPDHAVDAHPVQWRRVLDLAQERFPEKVKPHYWHALFTEEETYSN